MLSTHFLGLLLAFPVAPETAFADVDVTGVFEYEDKGYDYGGWTGADPILPIRRAKVQVLENGSVIGTGVTGQDGSYSIPVSVVGQIEIEVRVVADTNGDPGFQRIRVQNQSSSTYASTSPQSYFIDDTMTSFDVGTLLVSKTTFSGDEANPFNMLDMGVAAWEYITEQANRTKVPSTVTVRWPSGSGSFASGSTAFMADDDGYDDCVILHELGHVIHNLYSDNDELGGSHFFGDSDQDPRLSLGEGFASFLGGVVQDAQLNRRALYMDLRGSSQTAGVQLRLRLEEVTPYAGDSFGAADEASVACVLFDITDDENSKDNNLGTDDEDFDSTTLINGLSVHEAWFAVFEGPVAAAFDLTLNDFWDGWFSIHGVGGMHPELEALYRKRRVQFFNDDDEPNDTRLTAAPVDEVGPWVLKRTLYSGSGVVPVPGTGDLDWYAVDLVIGSRVSIETRYPNGAADADTQADTQLAFYDPDGNQVSSNLNGGTGRNALISNVLVDETGSWTFRARNTSALRDYGGYDFRVTYDFENRRPEVVKAPAASPRVLARGQTASLSVGATDDQALTYAWTPLNGGQVVGSGPNVTFVPPSRGRERLYRIDVTITDSLGAETGPLRVTVDTRVRGLRVP